MLCIVLAVYGQCPVDRDDVVMNEHDFENVFFHCRFLPIETRLRPDLADSHYRICVGSQSGRCLDIFSRFYYAKDTN